MRLALVAVGRLKAGPERELCERYAERLAAIGRGQGFDAPQIIEIAESQARRTADRKAEEGAAIADALPAGARIILFDENGTTLDSSGFAAAIGRWRDEGAPALALVIGGADGLDPALRRRADLVLAFGKLTIPHQIVRALVLEQLYRAATILAGHPYHRV